MQPFNYKIKNGSEIDPHLLEVVELQTDGVVAVTLRQSDLRHVGREVSSRVTDVHRRLLFIARQHPHLQNTQHVMTSSVVFVLVA